MKKICFSCGKKFDKLSSNRCEKCFFEKNEIIKNFKIPKIKYCNFCKKILYKNFYYPLEEFEKKFFSIAKNSLILNNSFKLNKLKIENFSIENEKLNFDVNLNINIK